MPTLYLVPTPLGDPDDITLRALRILREVRAIATDSPTDTQALIDRHGISTMIIDYDSALAALPDGDVALVTASGTPGIGDAAHEIVRAAIARGIRVEPLPGASAEITALVLSGLPTDAFVCVGALPDDLNSLALERDTMIFVTSSVTTALDRLLASLGDRRVCVAAALTQPGEIVFRGTTDEALAYFGDQPAPGSVVLVVAGAPPQVEAAWDEARVRAELRARLAAGEPLKLAAKAVASAAGWDRRVVYALGVDEKRNPP
ncbi:MAG: SAM-dependent methyltransferase [Anaerolineae bacterium]